MCLGPSELTMLPSAPQNTGPEDTSPARKTCETQGLHFPWESHVTLQKIKRWKVHSHPAVKESTSLCLSQPVSKTYLTTDDLEKHQPKLYLFYFSFLSFIRDNFSELK